ncbi:unnamed protein product [Rotaria sp. Silwood1]|nr:unnamed protein product [Rotaria sp. Silwood1]
MVCNQEIENLAVRPITIILIARIYSCSSEGQPVIYHAISLMIALTGESSSENLMDSHESYSNDGDIATLSDAKSELVIPAVKSGGSVTDIFTRFNSHQDSTKNFCLTDILMCTTAAPTYFPAYQFNSSVYVDGGVQANIPAMIAYDHASKSYPHYDRNRVRLLSLGTGDYVPDPLNLNANRNLLFWARNHQSVFKILMDGPQNNIDLHLNSVLGDNYYRWQIWLENPIDLDDIQDKSINRLIDLAHGHLEEMEAYDNRHRLGCLIEKFRS